MKPDELRAQAALQFRNLAERIYVELACRIALEPAKPDQPKPSAENLAKLSFRLAESFQQVADERSTAKAAVTDKYELKTDDMAAWNK